MTSHVSCVTILYITMYLDTQHKTVYYINTLRPEFFLVIEQIRNLQHQRHLVVYINVCKVCLSVKV